MVKKKTKENLQLLGTILIVFTFIFHIIIFREFGVYYNETSLFLDIPILVLLSKIVFSTLSPKQTRIVKEYISAESTMLLILIAIIVGFIGIYYSEFGSVESVAYYSLAVLFLFMPLDMLGVD